MGSLVRLETIKAKIVSFAIGDYSYVIRRVVREKKSNLHMRGLCESLLKITCEQKRVSWSVGILHALRKSLRVFACTSPTFGLSTCTFCTSTLSTSNLIAVKYFLTEPMQKN